MERILLDLNKNGLSYLTSSTSSRIQTSTTRRLSTSSRRRRRSPRSCASMPTTPRSTNSRESPITTSPATTRSNQPCMQKQQAQGRSQLSQKGTGNRGLQGRGLDLHRQHAPQHLRHLLLPQEASRVRGSCGARPHHARQGRRQEPQGKPGGGREVVLQHQDAVALQPRN